MPRLARVVAPGCPHHVIQRGNRRQPVFFRDEDYALYIDLMAEWCAKCGVAVWAYCLMPNHVHLITVPETSEALRAAVGEAHRRYTNYVNFREDWRGHLWQGRFASYVMDEQYLLTAARYIERNPVRAGMVEAPWDYLWSSAGAHLSGRDNALVRTAPLLELVGDWRSFLLQPGDVEDGAVLCAHERTGRPLGGPAFVARLEGLLGRALAARKPGPKPKKK